MNKETINKILPRLRFPEFQRLEEWIFEPFGQLYSFKGTNSFTRDNLNYNDGAVKNIHYGDIHTKFSTLFDVRKERVPYINEELLIKNIKKECYCREGDMVFADASEDLKDVGKSIELVFLNNEKILSGLHTLLARQKETKIIVGFGGYLFLSDGIRTQIQREAQGAKVLGISATRLSNIKIYYPLDKNEQQKIADCLSSIDDLITAHTQKLHALKAHKKGLMQQLFPVDGKAVPSLRFKEFEKSGEWKEKTFDQLFSIGSGKDYKHLSNGKIPVYGSGGYMLSVDEYLYNGKSVCIGRKGTIDKPMFLTGKFWTVDTLFYTHSFKDCIPEFIYLVFQNINWLKHNEAGGIPSLSKTIICKIKVYIPKPDEQQRIADCLFSLDELITLQSQRIETLKSHKKGLMQGLFPCIDNI